MKQSIHTDSTEPETHITSSRSFQIYMDELGRGIAEGRKQIWLDLEMVVEIASGYAGQGLGTDELIAEGNLGLANAIDEFNRSEKPMAFASMARNSIHESIKTALGNYGITTVGAMLTDDADSHAADGPDIIADYCDKEDAWLCYRLIGALEERQGTVFKYYLGIGLNKPMCLAEIGDIYDLSRERVRQIRSNAELSLRWQARKYWERSFRPSNRALRFLLDWWYLDFFSLNEMPLGKSNCISIT